LENAIRAVTTIIAGDFNSIATFAAPQTLLKNGFVDSFAECNKNPESLPTWHWPMKNGELSLRVDYIFHSKDFQATETGVIKSDASDHSLIFSRLKWADK
jgi:endonuclease/exonuclease/phosphatase (EEP) superfamily protein YafD